MPLVVVCSGCGDVRTAHLSDFGHLYPAQCGWCGELGWHEVDAPHLAIGHQLPLRAKPECDGGMRGGFDAAFGTIRREPGMPRGSGVCGVCGDRLRLNYDGLIPSHDNLLQI